MTTLNQEFTESCDINFAFIPVDMQTGNNGANWHKMAMCDRVALVLLKAAGTAGDDPVFTVNQAKDNAGGSSKALTFTKYRSKIGAIATAANRIWTITTQAAAGTATLTGAAASAAIVVVEIQGKDLDLANGFAYVQITIPDTGTNAQLGTAIYIAVGLKQPQQTGIDFLA